MGFAVFRFGKCHFFISAAQLTTTVSGALLKAKGDLMQAEADLSRAIELKLELAVAWAERGLARLLRGREDEAQQDFDRCLALNKALKPWLDHRIAEAKRRLVAKAVSP